MITTKKVGRVLGVLLLLQMSVGLTLPFIILRPRLVGFPAFLTAAAANAFQVRTAVFLSFLGGALTVGIAITVFPVFRQYSYRMALWFLSVCVISCTLDYVHNATVMSILSLSRQYSEAGFADPQFFQALGAVVVNSRKWAHYTQLVGFGVWIFSFYAALWRFTLIPRVLASLGVIGILLQFTGVTLFTFLGYAAVTQMALPMGPIQLAVAAWLIVRGFDERRVPVPKIDEDRASS